ncbi:hypothetical protein JTE90_014973 [Oedothorax gibbosus]|uniref:Uncharacterized protein n=1 Tax=Oedothorax gibbosus TaxID=931172 RepID=A0AAV6UZE1_9ARAC|nr:hypothetical protein JTE90_014973 [Oedothorax gibbosus]
MFSQSRVPRLVLWESAALTRGQSFYPALEAPPPRLDVMANGGAAVGSLTRDVTRTEGHCQRGGKGSGSCLQTYICVPPNGNRWVLLLLCIGSWGLPCNEDFSPRPFNLAAISFRKTILNGFILTVISLFADEPIFKLLQNGMSSNAATKVSKEQIANKIGTSYRCSPIPRSDRTSRCGLFQRASQRKSMDPHRKDSENELFNPREELLIRFFTFLK